MFGQEREAISHRAKEHFTARERRGGVVCVAGINYIKRERGEEGVRRWDEGERERGGRGVLLYRRGERGGWSDQDACPT